MIKPIVFSFCSIGGRCHEWDLGALAQFQVVELRVSGSETPTQWAPNLWLCLQILNQGNPSLNSMGDQFSIPAL